jgi:ABC-2 type transport system ATP-binding protein
MIYETAAEGTTVFVTTHYMDEAEYCDRISIMVPGGSRRMGAPGELMRNTASGRSTSSSCGWRGRPPSAGAGG